MSNMNGLHKVDLDARRRQRIKDNVKEGSLCLAGHEMLSDWPLTSEARADPSGQNELIQQAERSFDFPMKVLLFSLFAHLP